MEPFIFGIFEEVEGVATGPFRASFGAVDVEDGGWYKVTLPVNRLVQKRCASAVSNLIPLWGLIPCKTVDPPLTFG